VSPDYPLHENTDERFETFAASPPLQEAARTLHPEQYPNGDRSQDHDNCQGSEETDQRHGERAVFSRPFRPILAQQRPCNRTLAHRDRCQKTRSEEAQDWTHERRAADPRETSGSAARPAFLPPVLAPNNCRSRGYHQQHGNQDRECCSSCLWPGLRSRRFASRVLGSFWGVPGNCARFLGCSGSGLHHWALLSQSYGGSASLYPQAVPPGDHSAPQSTENDQEADPIHRCAPLQCRLPRHAHPMHPDMGKQEDTARDEGVPPSSVRERGRMSEDRKRDRDFRGQDGFLLTGGAVRRARRDSWRDWSAAWPPGRPGRPRKANNSILSPELIHQEMLACLRHDA